MAYRDRTGLYITFRQSYSHHGQRLELSGWDPKEERQSLVHKDNKDNTVIEMDMLAPRWVTVEGEIDSLLLNTRRNINLLDKQYAKHVLPSFSDKTEQENEIQRLTIQITQDFQRCQKLLQVTKAQTNSATGSEALMAKNFLSNLASRIQTESAQFRKKQSTYLKSMLSRVLLNKCTNPKFFRTSWFKRQHISCRVKARRDGIRRCNFTIYYTTSCLNGRTRRRRTSYTT